MTTKSGERRSTYIYIYIIRGTHNIYIIIIYIIIIYETESSRTCGSGVIILYAQ